MAKSVTFANNVLNAIRTKGSKHWTAKGDKEALKLFHEMAVRVPAYTSFLKLHKINHKNIKSREDLSLVPTTTKDNYLRKYPFHELSWDGKFSQPGILTSTSGSTGKPVYFSRNHQLNLQSSVIHELYLGNNGFKKTEPTLIIIAFGMGVWIGGQITFQAFEMMRNRGYPLSIITPGINKGEIIKILRDIAPSYKQVLLAGYPPFVKDIVDEARHKRIPLGKMNLRLLFAAEPFTDKFRQYISKKAGVANQYLDTMNIYGTAELGTMAFETPLSIFIRRAISKKPKLFNDIFPSVTKTPTLAQFIPSFTDFQDFDGKIIISGDSALPLMRYSVGDNGGVVPFEEMVTKFKDHGVDLEKEVRKKKMNQYFYKLPFVYVYERADFSTTLYGLQVYPEPIREVLLFSPYDSILTGKFTLMTKFDSRYDQYLEINLEIQPNKNITKAFEKQLSTDIVDALRTASSEFRELTDQLTKNTMPRLVFWPTEDPLYFKPGIKQKWVAKK